MLAVESVIATMTQLVLRSKDNIRKENEKMLPMRKDNK